MIGPLSTREEFLRFLFLMALAFAAVCLIAVTGEIS